MVTLPYPVPTPGAPKGAGRQGFTLLEAMVAMVLSTIVVSLVTSTFLAQNRFYTDAMSRVDIHESVRGGIARASADLRSVFQGGIVSADRNSIVFRAPVLVGGVCGVDGQSTFAFLPVDQAVTDMSTVSGYGVKVGDAAWRYTPGTWASVYHSSGGGAVDACARAGADTTGAASEFVRLDGMAPAGVLSVGDLVMLYQKVELKLAPSKLDPETRALFRGPAGGVLTEVATGMSRLSRFEYGLARNDRFRRRVRGQRNLARIDRVRISLQGTGPASGGGRDDLTFELTQTVPLRNAN